MHRYHRIDGAIIDHHRKQSLAIIRHLKKYRKLISPDGLEK